MVLMLRILFLFLCLYEVQLTAAQVVPGCERLLVTPKYRQLLVGKKIGLITNQTAIDSAGNHTIAILKGQQKSAGYTLAALFAPEHGLDGYLSAGEKVPNTTAGGLVVHSLHGGQRRPTDEMLATVDLLIYDIQDLGSRSYTYATTLFYAMEEAAKRHIPVVVLDRPNPINGVTVDGPVLEKQWRSFVGYLEIPYCHGMTIGELARYFNGEYDVGCELHVVAMEGWRRTMTFTDTGLLWMPTSPNIPEATTPLYYPMTGILGELQIASIGIGYPLPFKVVGAPWIDGELFAKQLNEQKFPGILFLPFHFRPHSGRHANEVCHGVLLHVTDPLRYLPVTTQYLILGMLKSLYPKEFRHLYKTAAPQLPMFHKINGTEAVAALLESSKPAVWPLRSLHSHEKKLFMEKRRRYLIEEYGKE